MTGRLLEVWVTDVHNSADLVPLLNGFRKVLERGPANLVVCGDYRRATELTPLVATTLLQCFKMENPRLDRAALLVPMSSPILRRQMEKIVLEAGHSERRICSDPADVRAWVASRLSPSEQGRLERFLSPGGPP
jgi:hypothetical protein